MSCEILASDEFRFWYEPLTEGEQESITRVVNMLEEAGATLEFPYSSGISGSKVRHLRELRVQHAGRPYRVLYAFDPKRMAYLLIGGEKTGNARWYEVNVPKAEAIYKQYLRETGYE